ncbi:pseudaminic acid cytidylyltransferase [Denitrobaculum tricleocarpae]|uniref:Pseudaminic acid cytidylyltransferase n=1 Tax=Denitrobaculum tricleocarpae TaxID=2591009 RepID=A0A545TY00_9PROT|nr:pseudaminic acid cytidylyltransferase [Denitrobaculum tricleocarpae]TQV82074.1 pseudaminic acid cytidylyltransferase [Denitrobaculum tricleocarpae]
MSVDTADASTKKKLAVIPARGGSKRIPRKNIRSFRGRPIIAWSIDAALGSGLFDEVMVSTDSEEISNTARECGASVPFLRSSKTSDDHATTSDVLLEVLGCYGERGQQFDVACCLYPTAPFVTSNALTDGLRQLEIGSFDVVMPVTRFDYPIWRSLKMLQGGKISLNFPENLNARSQDLPPAFHDAGQWYWFRIAEFLREKVLMGSNTGAVELPSSEVQDIDTLDDWVLAEMKHERMMS